VTPADPAGAAIGAASAWLDAFEAAVRARDYDAGRDLFVVDALGFGSVVSRCDGLDPLVAGQWRHVWPRIERFTFDRAPARTFASDELLVVATTWTSVGVDLAGRRFERPGRVTLALARDAVHGAWRCVHSHYSLVPGTERPLG